MITVAQKRCKTGDFGSDQTISDFEKTVYSQEDYENIVTDTTVSYSYTLYVFSRCTGYLASTPCNGVHVVQALNKGRFGADEIVREMIAKEELVEGRR